MVSKIIPSTKLKVISVHKLGDISCWRNYFWFRILNLEPRGINLNFWYGGVLGAGFEQMLLGGKYNRTKIEKVLSAESKRRTQRHRLTPDDTAEIKLQRQLISLFLAGVAKQKFFKDMRMTESQVKVSYSIMPGITFHGTLDGLGTYKDKSSSFEFKTAARITDKTFETLLYDKQVYGYPIGLKLSKKSYPTKCCYIIFRKTQKRIKKNQTEDEFVQEIKEDIATRPDFYYIHYPLSLGKTTMEQVKKDIFAGTRILKTIYDSLAKKELLNPESWPKCEKQCSSFSGCPFMILCRHPQRWRVYSRLFQQREMLYEEEKKELET